MTLQLASLRELGTLGRKEGRKKKERKETCRSHEYTNNSVPVVSATTEDSQSDNSVPVSATTEDP
jgi:hypothetical protein